MAAAEGTAYEDVLRGAEAAAVAAGVDPDVAARVVRWHPTVSSTASAETRARAVPRDVRGHALRRLLRADGWEGWSAAAWRFGPSRGATPRFLPGPARCPGRPPPGGHHARLRAHPARLVGRSWERRRQK